MKAIVKKGKELIDFIYMNKTDIIMNTKDKWLFNGKEVKEMKEGKRNNFKFNKNVLTLHFKNLEDYREVPENLVIEVTFSGDVKTCEIDSICKDQIYFNITT